MFNLKSGQNEVFILYDRCFVFWFCYASASPKSGG